MPCFLGKDFFTTGPSREKLPINLWTANPKEILQKKVFQWIYMLGPILKRSGKM